MNKEKNGDTVSPSKIKEKLLKFKINFDIFTLNKCWKNFTPRFDSCQFDLKFKKIKIDLCIVCLNKFNF